MSLTSEGSRCYLPSVHRFGVGPVRNMASNSVLPCAALEHYIAFPTEPRKAGCLHVEAADSATAHNGWVAE